jgi:hypothetical protein
MGGLTSTSHTGYALPRRWELKVNQGKERRHGPGYKPRLALLVCHLTITGGDKTKGGHNCRLLA